jgi:uncharacterized protein YbbK (DUF523 family)
MIAKVFVSACLLGENVRYHGGSAKVDSPILERWFAEGRIVSLCPEVAGGLGAPRPPAEIRHGVVMMKTGRDVTEAFLDGARQAVALARESGARVAVLKSKSPSCGTGRIYDGTFSGTFVTGSGVTAAALEAEGVRVFDETQLEDADAALRNL